MEKQKVFTDTTPLAALATFTSATFGALTSERITGLAFSDKAATLTVEQSDDGTTFRVTDTVTVSANTATKYDARLVAGHVRVKVKNDDAVNAQTSFSVSGYLEG